MEGRCTRRLRAGDEGGATLVEFAIVLPVLMTLIFGVVEFGIVFNDYIGLRQGARDAARQAVVAEFGSVSCTPVGYSTAGATKNLMCLAKDRSAQEDVRVKIIVPTPYIVGSTMVVCTQKALVSHTGLFAGILNDIEIKTEVKMRVEQVGPLTSAAESAPTGGDWSWCTA
jgi:hypothetical protein